MGKRTLIDIILIFVFSIAIGCVANLLYQYFIGDRQPSIIKDVYEPEILRLKSINDSLTTIVFEEKKKYIGFQAKYDSLNHSKNTIKTKYVKVYEKIDTLAVNGIVSEYSSIFTDNNIK